MRPLTAWQRARMRSTTEATFEGEAIRRRYPVIEDRYGNETRDTANPADVPGIPVVLWQEGATENRDDRDRQVEDWLARVPVGTDITGRDVLLVDGRTFEVIGAPLDAGTHLRLELRFVEG